MATAISTESVRGRTALCVSHVVGMIDMVALPVWVGTLIAQYRFEPVQAGGLATIFLLGMVIASIFCASRFSRIPVKIVVPAGYAVTALAFALASLTSDYLLLALLHAGGGLLTGCSLSVTHGTIGRCQNPHRIFALAQFCLGGFSILFLGSTPLLVDQFGGPALFWVFAVVMLVGALVTAFIFPTPTWIDEEALPETAKNTRGKIPLGVWFGIAGVSLMATNQAMVFSFIERIGTDFGFALELVAATLVAVGFVNLLPAILAAALQNRWPARRVMVTGPLVQAGLVLIIVNAVGFWNYAVAAAVYPFIMIFTHTFAFGFLARRDPSGRAVAATPAMNMIGSCIGPILGGSLVQLFGYTGLGYAALLISMVAVVSFSLTNYGKGVDKHPDQEAT